VTSTAARTAVDDAVATLEDLDSHHDRYDRDPEKLTAHLRGSGRTIHPHEESDLATLVAMHHADHRVTARAAKATLADAQDALADVSAR
jgi:hypothetical protein